MPNLWTSTYQKMYESFYGPRTIDTEFNMKVEELKACEKSLQGVRSLLMNFTRNTQGIKIMCKDVYINLPFAYAESSIYMNHIQEIAQVHQEVERLYDNMADLINILGSQTVDWERNFDDVKKNLQIRDQSRRDYDHYDEKLEKLVKSRQEKSLKGLNETPKDIEIFDRNDLKYKQSTDIYIKQSSFTYNQMCELLEFRFKLINPAVSSFLIEEKKFFQSVSDLFKRFDNIQSKFQSLERQAGASKKNTYDPCKYIRGHQLLSGVNLDQLQNKQLHGSKAEPNKFSFDDYLKTKGGPNVNLNVNTSTGNVQSNIQNKSIPEDVNQYSYEYYLMNKGQTKSKIKNINQNDEQNIDNFYIQQNINRKKTSTNEDVNYLNFDINLSEPDDIKRTTIFPQDDFTHGLSDHNVDNPYSLLQNFTEFNPQRNQSMTNSGSIGGNFGNSNLNMNSNMNNRSQIPINNINQPRVSQSQTMNQNFPQNNNINYNRSTTGTNNQGGFPR